MGAPVGGEEGNVLIIANKMDGALPVWHSPQGQPREGAASFRARPVSWDVHFPLTECEEGRGTRARGRREAISSALAICLPGPAMTPPQQTSAWLPVAEEGPSLL